MIAILGLVLHLGGALSIFSRSNWGAHWPWRPRLEHHAGPAQCWWLAAPGGRLVLLQEMAGTDTRLWPHEHAYCAIKACATAVQRLLVQLVLYSRMAEVLLQPQAVDAQHGLAWNRRAATQSRLCATGEHGNEGHQGCRRRDLVHLVEEDFYAGIVLDTSRRGCSGVLAFVDLP